jgi:predicted DNA-binding transcriptional regulator AlpA
MKDKASPPFPKKDDPLGLIRQDELLKYYLPVSESTLDRMIERDEFPRPVRCSARIKMWRIEDILQWRSQLSE